MFVRVSVPTPVVLIYFAAAPPITAAVVRLLSFKVNTPLVITTLLLNVAVPPSVALPVTSKRTYSPPAIMAPAFARRLLLLRSSISALGTPAKSELLLLLSAPLILRFRPPFEGGFAAAAPSL